jgi:hypothetical protein
MLSPCFGWLTLLSSARPHAGAIELSGSEGNKKLQGRPSFFSVNFIIIIWDGIEGSRRVTHVFHPFDFSFYQIMSMEKKIRIIYKFM